MSLQPALTSNQLVTISVLTFLIWLCSDLCSEHEFAVKSFLLNKWRIFLMRLPVIACVLLVIPTLRDMLSLSVGAFIQHWLRV